MRSIVVIILICLAGCNTHTRWTEKERTAFAEKCLKTDTSNDLSFSLTGFNFDEIKSIVVRQIHAGKVVDSFSVYPNKNTFDSLSNEYLAYIDRPVYIKDTLNFVIPGYAPFVLSDVKMVMWPQWTQFSENYGCVLGDYKINGVRFEHSTHPNLIKAGFISP